MNDYDSSKTTGRTVSRRDFVAAGTSLALGFTIVPRHVLGGVGFVAASERVNVAGIGAGGMGGGDIATHARNGANIVALCDVDEAARRRLVQRLSQGAPLQRLSRDDRQGGQKHRRRHGRHARPYPRRGLDGRDPRRQARLLPEAAHPHAARMPRTDQGRARRRRRHADGQPGACQRRARA